MRISAVMKWAGPAAIVSAVFMIFSDLLNLTIYVPVSARPLIRATRPSGRV
jgi:hypothetical protein